MPLSQRLIHQSRQTPGYRAMTNSSAGMRCKMQMTDALRKKEKDYGQMAQAHVSKLDPKARQNLPTIKPDTDEWRAWERYFIGHLGFRPWAMQHVLKRHSMDETDAAMTVPTQWPEWFDTSYTSVRTITG
jgi:hypothetical protein